MPSADLDGVAIEEGPLLTAWKPGLTVGRYTMMGKIAIGGMAEIWLARQAGLKGFEKVVVIKKILDSYCSDDAFVEMFLDEARTAAQLNHSNVVQIYDLGEHNRSYFIAMEYLAGETVARVARQAVKAGTPLTYAFAARLVAEAAAGLGYAHTKKSLSGQPLNIVHRDVSPQNLILTYDGQLKVLDFGVARAANRATLTEEGKFKGKVPYMSPEQARAESIDHRADIFALGIILYELIGRCRLFQHEDFVVGLKAVAADEPVPSVLTRNPEVPPALSAIAQRALERNRAHRYQTAEELRAALEEWLRTQPDNPGTPALAAFMQELFAERIAKTTKLIEAARAGLVGTPDTGAGTPVSTSGELSMPGGKTPVVQLGPRSRGKVFAVVGGVAVALVALGLALRPSAPVKADPAIPIVAPPAATALTIETDPPGAVVTVDGEERGASPLTLEPILPGSHVVKASADGYEPGERTVEIKRTGERTNLLLTLKPVAPPAPTAEADPTKPVSAKAVAKGKLTLSTTPWSQVFEGTKKLGETPLVDFSLPAGRHTLRLKNDEKKLSKTITVEIKAGKTTLLKEKL